MKHCLTIGVFLFAVAVEAQTFRFYAVGGKSLQNWHGQADVGGFAFELEKPLTRRTEVGFVIAPYYVNQPVSWFGGEPEESIRAVHGALTLRHHFRMNAKTARPYVEIGSGPMWAERRVPAATSRFNFISQGTIGVTLMPDRPLSWIAGYRFMHISNGGYAPRNPGLNINSVVIGARVRR